MLLLEEGSVEGHGGGLVEEFEAVEDLDRGTPMTQPKTLGMVEEDASPPLAAVRGGSET